MTSYVYKPNLVQMNLTVPHIMGCLENNGSCIQVCHTVHAKILDDSQTLFGDTYSGNEFCGDPVHHFKITANLIFSRWA